MDFQRLEASFGGRWLHGMFLLILVTFGVRVMREDPSGTATPKPQPAPTELVASVNDPLMAEAIRMATAQHYEDGPWGGAQRNAGPKVSIPTPSGSIELTHEQIRDANFYYPQLVANPAIARSNYSSHR